MSGPLDQYPRHEADKYASLEFGDVLYFPHSDAYVLFLGDAMDETITMNLRLGERAVGYHAIQLPRTAWADFLIVDLPE